MTLRIRPVKLKDTQYLLIPKNIAKILDITEATTFLLTIENGKNTTSLAYKIENMDKGENNE